LLNKRKSKNIIVKFCLFIIALLLIPLTVGFLLNFPVLFSNFKKLSSKMVFSILGFLFFIMLYFLLGTPVKSYIIEHELTHIIFTLISGIRVKKISLKGNAYVKTEKVNLLIALSPYSLPLYTIIILSIYKFLALFYRSNVLSIIFYFFASASLSFHIIVTVHYLSLDQPDLKRYGYFSSLIFVFLWSMGVMALILAYMFENVELIPYFRQSWIFYIEFYTRIIKFLQ